MFPPYLLTVGVCAGGWGLDNDLWSSNVSASGASQDIPRDPGREVRAVFFVLIRVFYFLLFLIDFTE